MGRQHRVTKLGMTLAACATSVLCCATLYGCAKHEDVKARIRREVLRANNLDARRREAFDALRVTNALGDLLPSEQRVAGVRLPRGYQPKFTFDHEWTFDGEHPYDRLVKYFTEQLDSATVERPNHETLRFVQARAKDNPQMQPVTVTVSPVPGREDWSRIQILGRQPPPQHVQTKAEIEAELSLRRQNMH